MRRIVVSSVAALGFLAVGMTALSQPASIRTAADRAGVQTTVAMVDTNHNTRPLLVAINLFQPSDTGTG